jgi:hypothetical protein
MSNWKYNGNIKGMQVIGQMGGSNGHFLGIAFLNPDDNKEYNLDTDSRGWLHFSESKNPSQRRTSVSPEYNIDKYIILYGEPMVGEGYYANIVLQHPFDNKQAILQSHNGRHIDAVMQKIYRKKASIRVKSKRKIVKGCKCK